MRDARKGSGKGQAEIFWGDGVERGIWQVQGCGEQLLNCHLDSSSDVSRTASPGQSLLLGQLVL